MKRLITILFFFLLLTGIALAGTTGKLKGKVTDQQTGEPLIGANVLMVGTSFGAATNINGEYTITNLQPGSYEVRFSYIGYQTKTISNIRVSTDLTTELNSQLEPEGVQVGEVLVVAEKQLINKSNTNAQRITTSDDIDALPVRGVQQILALTPGIVLQDKTIFIRGGRQDEVGYYLEGTNVTDPMVGGSRITMVQDAIEEISVQAGGYTAEFGGSNSGIIRSQIKSGTPDWRFSLEYITDNLGFKGSDDRYTGEKTLGAYWWGYNETIATLSGPILGNTIKFFGLFNYNYVRDQNPQSYPGINIGYLHSANGLDSVDFTYPAGPVFKNSLENYTGTGSLTFDFNPVIIRLVGSYTTSTSFNPFSAPTRISGNIANFLNTDRTEQVEQSDGAFSLKATYLINSTTFVEVSGGYSFATLDRFDPYLKDNFLAYGDSVANADVGFTWTRRPSQGGDLRYTRQPRIDIYDFSIIPPGDVIAGYQNWDRNSMNFNAALSTVLGKVHNVKVGGELQIYEVRNYGWGNEGIFAMAGLLAAPPTGLTEKQIYVNRGVNNYGYDYLGNEYNGSDIVDKPHEPVFGAFYIQDKLEFSDLIVNVGLRYDYIDIDNYMFSNPNHPEYTFNKDDGTVWDVNGDGTYINPDGDPALVEVPSFSSVSPRIGFSFPVTDLTVFHAQFGKFVQQSRLRDAYQGLYATSNNLGGGFFIGAPVGFNVRPTRTTQYEIGFTQQIGEVASVDITGYYKDIQDQVVYDLQKTDVTSNYGAYFLLKNGDFATTKGVEISFNMRRFQRFLVNGSFAWQDAQGTGSYPNSNRGIVGAPIDGVTLFSPQYVSPLEYNNAFRGNLNVDYRFGKGDGGPILQELGLSTLLTFASGHPYTRGIGGDDLEGDARDRQPIEPLSSSTTPATFQVDLRLDKSFNIADMLNLNVYIYVVNLFDARNIQNVFLRTGTTDDDGYISNPSLGGQLIETYGPDYETLYRAINIDYFEQWQLANNTAAILTNPLFYGPPREIRIGFRLEH